MTTPQFEEYYKKLNPRQKQAVDTIEGPVMVIAGPGTGKTQILTLRIANILLKTDTNPSNILALAFTESAVLAMRKRLVEMIGTDGYKVYLATFHGFCNEVIQNNPEDFPHLISSTSITELEQIEIIQSILESSSLSVLRPFGDPLYYTRSILSAINDLKKEGVSPEEFQEVIYELLNCYKDIPDLYYDKGPNKGKKKGKYLTLEKDLSKNKELSEVYQKYQLELKCQHFYDYNDMIVEVVNALSKNENLLTRLQEQYQYLLVDEHQDTNASQNKIIELLSSFYPEGPNLFVVGDEKQAIYRFQGASLENFLYFKSLYKDAVLINLDQNYRSSQTVLDAAASLISKNILPVQSGIVRENLKAEQPFPKLPIKILDTDNYYAEFLEVAFNIQQKIKDKVLPNQIAVIYRNNRDVTPLAEIFDQLKIPYLIHSEQDLLEDLDIQKLLLIFQAVNHFCEDEYLWPLLHISLFNIPAFDSFKLLQFSRKSKLSLYDLIKDPSKIKALNLENAESLADLYQKLLHWSKLKNDDCLENLFTYLINESGFLKALFTKPDSLNKLEKLAGLHQELKNLCQRRSNVSLEQFMNHLELLKSHQILIKKPAKNNQNKAINFMTAHRSKGLEFEYVYVINAFDGHWGNKRKNVAFKIPWQELGVVTTTHDEDLNQDERRLFYVAMTRAKRQVTISYSKVGFDGREQLPTQFIEEIDEQFKEKVIIESKDEEIKQFMEKLLSIREPRAISVEDKEFLKELFLTEGLSVSGLNNYLKCPWQYFYENLLQVPSIKDKQQIFGTAIHTAICKTHFLKTPDKVQLTTFFKESLDKEPLSKNNYAELLEKGGKLLANYFDNYPDLWSKEVICELSIKNIMLSDQIKINGRIDRIEKIPNSKEVIIFDIKTGKPKTRGTIEGSTQASSGDYKRQLNFYKLLLDSYESGKMVAKQGIIDFVESDNKGQFHREVFEYDPAELEALKNQILYVANQIINLEFWESRCEDKDCQYCRLRDFLEQ